MISDFPSLATDSGSGISVPQEFLEKEPVGLQPGIEIKNLRKVFNTEKGLQLNFFVAYIICERLYSRLALMVCRTKSTTVTS